MGGTHERAELLSFTCRELLLQMLGWEVHRGAYALCGSAIVADNDFVNLARDLGLE